MSLESYLCIYMVLNKQHASSLFINMVLNQQHASLIQRSICAYIWYESTACKLSIKIYLCIHMVLINSMQAWLIKIYFYIHMILNQQHASLIQRCFMILHLKIQNEIKIQTQPLPWFSEKGQLNHVRKNDIHNFNLKSSWDLIK